MPDSPRLFQINTSGGGVPKIARPEAWIGESGLAGDHQTTPEIHGGVERAVCLFSLERIQALQQEGHPIFPGALGENLTLTGLDWEAVTPGKSLQIGEAVILEVTRYTSPCKTIAPAFVDNYFNRVSQKLFPGWSRVYARVVAPGLVRTGDEIAILASLQGE